MLTGLALDILNCCGHAGNGGNGGNMLYPLVGQAKGKTVRICGNGPSLLTAKPNGEEITIACNNALANVPGADIWLVAECEVHRKGAWFFDHTEYAGLTIWDASMVLPMNDLLGDNAARKAAGLSHYSDDFLGRVVWYLRQGLDGATTGPIEPFRSFADGLYGYLPMKEVDGEEIAGRYEHGELYGSVLMQAIHLAAGMGADEVNLYGCELSWGLTQAQHADGSRTFTALSEPVNIPHRIGIGGRWGTFYFLDSARAIQWYAEMAGVMILDHSGGLLSP